MLRQYLTTTIRDTLRMHINDSGSAADLRRDALVVVPTSATEFGEALRAAIDLRRDTLQTAITEFGDYYRLVRSLSDVIRADEVEIIDGFEADLAFGRVIRVTKSAVPDPPLQLGELTVSAPRQGPDVEVTPGNEAGSGP